MRGRWIGLAVAVGAGFGLGALSARHSAEPGEREPEQASYVVVSPVDAGVGTRIVFDPASIQLLPDASLRLELPRGFDAGVP